MDMVRLIQRLPCRKIALANTAWFFRVKPDGPWDHKPLIAKFPGLGAETGPGKGYRYHVPGTPYEIYYDVWSNIHFGYVGRVAHFGPNWLQWAAAQVGITDHGDEISIDIGMDLSGSRGVNLSRSDVDQAVRAHLYEYSVSTGTKATPFTARNVANWPDDE